MNGKSGTPRGRYLVRPKKSSHFDSLAGKLDRAWRGSTLELPHQEGSIAWKHSRQWSDFTHLRVTQPKLKGFCLGGGTSFLSLPYISYHHSAKFITPKSRTGIGATASFLSLPSISYNDGAKIRKSEISNGYRSDCVLCISV